MDFHKCKSAPGAVTCQADSDGDSPSGLPAKAWTTLELRLSCLGQEERARLPSLGAVLHATGECKPCAFNWKADGCHNGSYCLHCHACPKGEMRRRRKAKAFALRQAKLAGKKRQDAPEESDDDEDLVQILD